MRPTDPALRARLVPARRELAGVLFASIASGVLVVAQAFVVAGLVVALVQQRSLLPWAVAVGLVVSGRAVSGALVDRCAARAAVKVGDDLRATVVRAAVTPDPGLPAGEIAALGTRGVAAAEPYLTRYVPALVVAGVLPPLVVVAIATQDLLSAVIVLATLPLVPVFGALVGLATRDRAEQQWRALGSLSGHFVDVVRGLPTLVAYRRARAQSGRIRDITDRYRTATMRTLRIAFASSAVLELVATLSVALVAVVVGVRLAQGELGLQTALTALLLAPEAYWPLRRVGAEFHASAEGIASFEQVAALTVPDQQPGRTPPAGDLVVDGLTVRYPGRPAPALSGVTARIPRCGITAVVGPSGCGKSTLLAAVAGLLPHEAGAVTIDGIPMAGVDWQSAVAWVPQRPAFLAASLADNLRLAAPRATDPELWTALRRVSLADRVRELPDGLRTQLGEDGLTLSAGERARLALARAVLSDRPWVLLDEPTAHLDARTEAVILRVLRQLARDRAVIVVAHRPQLVALADQVIELEAVPPPVRQVSRPSPRAGSSPVASSTEQLTEASGPRVGRGFAVATLLGGLASASGVALTATAGWLIVQASTQPAVLTLLVAVVGVRTFGLARPALRYAERLRSHDTALTLLADRRVAVYDTLVPLTPGRLGRRRGDLLASVVDDVDCVVDREIRVRIPVRSGLMVVALAVILATWLEPRAGLALLLSALVGGGLALLIPALGGGRREARMAEARGQVAAGLVEAARIAPELVMWQAQVRAGHRVLEPADQLGRCALLTARGLAFGRAAAVAASGFGVVAGAYAVSPALADRSLASPMAALLVLMPLALGDVLVGFAEAAAARPRTRAAAERLHGLEQLTPAVSDPDRPVPPTGNPRMEGRGLSFAWADREVFDDLELGLSPGERLGVVGPSGSGKSTLAGLLLRFVDPTSGRLDLGGVPLRGLALDDVRREVGLVDDDPHVFASTLRENLRLARPAATDEELQQALEDAALGRWVDSLPDGLDTWLGDGHGEISGGERARLGLARALLADAPVLVLDEPTAHLDSGTAREVVGELFAATSGRSVVWISHDGEGLDRVDRTLVLA